MVAMATALTDSEEDTDTETEPPEGERGAAVGSDSTSEASTNTPMHVSHSYFLAKLYCSCLKPYSLHSNERRYNKNTLFFHVTFCTWCSLS